MNKPICIPTILGDIVAYDVADPDYPGIDIFLRRDGVEILLATVEAESYMGNTSLNYRVYGDLSIDEPTISDRIFPDELNEGFASLSEE